MRLKSSTRQQSHGKHSCSSKSYSRHSSLPSLLSSCLLLLASSPYPAHSQVDIQQIQIPKLSTSMGSMGVVGRYEGISRYQFVGQQSQQTQNDTYYDSIVAQVDGQFYSSIDTSNGRVYTSCQIDDVLFLQGNFTSFRSVSTPHGLAQFNMSLSEVSPIPNASELFQNDGSVSTLFCDTANRLLYLGGSFSFRNTSGSAIYDLETASWDLPSFGGFPGGSTVNSIISTSPSLSNSTIVFGGKFFGLANETLTSSSSTGNPDAIEIQRISFTPATIRADGSADGSNPRSIICPAGSTSNWEMTADRVGSWSSQWPFYINPTSIRLYNLDDDTNGLSLFRILSFPSNSIMNLTYVNQTTGTTMHCDAWCPLPRFSAVEYVDFSFVNVVGTNTIQIEILDYYGGFAGLSGIELFQRDAYTFANNSFNYQAECGQATLFTPIAQLSGTFEQPSVSAATFVTSYITDSSQLQEIAVTYEPNITVAGNYTVKLYTPGCIQDGTCVTRGGVNVTIEPGSNLPSYSQILYQSNYYDKYDLIYNGTLAKISTSFRPRVTVRPLLDQQVPVTFVADRLQTVLVSVEDGITINSLFEYSPTNFSSSTSNPVGNTTINQAGVLLGKDSEVYALSLANSNSIYVAGNITTESVGSNIFRIDLSGDGSVVKLPGSGLNNVVTGLVHASDSTTMVFGNFTDLGNITSSDSTTLNYVAFVDTSSGEFTSLGRGTNGPVTSSSIFNLNGTNVYVLGGPFTELRSATANYQLSDGTLPIWVTNESAWITESTLNSTFVQGRVTSSSSFNNTNYYTGFLRILSTLSSGASYTDAQFNLRPMPFSFISANNSDSSSSTGGDGTLRRRAVVPSPDGNTLYTGTFANSSFSIMGGHFRVQDRDNLIYSNLVMTENDTKVSGLPNNTIDDSSTFYALYVSNNILYAGGLISGTVNSNSVSGLVFYDLSTNSYSDTQPPGLSGGTGIVNNIAKQPNSNSLIVAGGFELAGSLTCNAMCIYDLGNTRWQSPTPGLGGEVTSMIFLGNNVVVLAGGLTLNNTSVYLATYDFNARTYSTYGSQSTDLPGPISSLVLRSSSLDSAFAAGIDSNNQSSYMAYWNGDSWSTVDLQLDKGTVISDISLLEVDDGHTTNSLLSGNEVLLLSGNIRLKDFGNVSSAMFDGNTLTPVFLTANKDGSTGAVNSFFTQQNIVFGNPTVRKHMKKVFVILISLAIAIGLTFILMALGLAIAYMRRRQEGYIPANSRVSEMDMAETIPPAELLEEMKHVPEHIVNNNSPKIPHSRSR